jgi:hypothetical protein
VGNPVNPLGYYISGYYQKLPTGEGEGEELLPIFNP